MVNVHLLVTSIHIFLDENVEKFKSFDSRDPTTGDVKGGSYDPVAFFDTADFGKEKTVTNKVNLSIGKYIVLSMTLFNETIPTTIISPYFF